MTRQSLRRRIEKLEKKHEPAVRITVYERTDGMHEWTLPNGEIELVTEAEFKARGGKIYGWVDQLIMKDERKG